MIIISDTSPLSNLLVIDRLTLLERMYGKVIIPRAVMEELLVLEKFGHDLSELRKSPWLEIKEPSNKELEEKLKEELDAGESAAIALALELKPVNLMIDEKKGRRIASELGIEIIGLVGILVEAKELGYIETVKPILDELRNQAGFRISHSFYQKILEKLHEK